jgi:broad specificity phosphatase PhoE
MTTTLLLTRHGQTYSNVTGFYAGWSNEDLNEAGYTQVRRLSSRLAGLPISAVYASPLLRTFSTASILAEPHRLEPELLDDLIEIRLGDWEGLHVDEIERRWQGLWQQSMTDPTELTMPNGESLREVTDRAIRAFEWVKAGNRGKHALIVTHEVVISSPC